MASIRHITGVPPTRVSNPQYASTVLLLLNVGPVTVWWGDGDVEPGTGMPLLPGEQVLITGPEVYLTTRTDITAPNAQSQFVQDWDARVAMAVRPA